MRAAVWVVACLALGACSTLGGENDTNRDATGKNNPYLQAGPTTDIDLGPGQTSLLEALKQEKDRALEMSTSIKKLRQETKDLNVRLARTEDERDREHVTRIAAEAQQKALGKKLRTKEARILNLAIKKAQLEREILLLEIAAAKKRLDEFDSRMSLGGKAGASK